MFSFIWPIAVAALLLCLGRRVSGQCNPLLGSCAAIQALNTTSYFVDFAQQSATPLDWIQADYETVNYGSNGAEFSLAQRGNAPYIWTSDYFLFGQVEIVMQAAPGTGVVTSAVLMSDDLDEIDWEFSGNNFGLSGGRVQTNYFGKGITGNYDRGTQPSVSDPTKAFHTYSLDWSTSNLVWSVDGTVLRTLPYSPATSGAYQYPQTPMRLHLGLWDAGDPNESQGVVQWAGGYTDLTKLPYTAYVKSAKITPSNPCANYVYSDKSGSYQSIQCNNITLPIASSSSSSTLSSTTMTSFPVASSATSPTVIMPVSSSAIGNTMSTTTSTSVRLSNSPSPTPISAGVSLSSSTAISFNTHSIVSLPNPPGPTSTSSGVNPLSSMVVSTTSVTANSVSSASSFPATNTVSGSSSPTSNGTSSSSSIAPSNISSGTPISHPTSIISSVAVTTSSASTSSTTPASAPVVIPTPTQSLSINPASSSTPPPTTPKPSPTPTHMQCNQDNCLRNMLDPRYASSVTRFCSSWLATATTPSDIPQVPPFLSGGCKNDFSRASSACNCVPTPTAMATLTSGAKKRSENPVRAFGRHMRSRRRYIYAHSRQEEGQMLPSDVI